MTDPDRRSVTRPREHPTSDDIMGEMTPNCCYVVADLVETFQEYDPARGTIRNRLEELAEENQIKRQKHANGTVTYRRPE